MSPSKSILKPHSSFLLTLSQIVQPLIVFLTGWISYELYLRPKPEFEIMPFRYQVTLLVGVLLTILIFNWFRVHRSWRGIRFFREFQTLTLAWGTVVITLIFVAFVTKTTIEFSRIWMVSWSLASYLFLFIYRTLIRVILLYTRSSGFNKRHVVIAGAGTLGQHIVQRLKLADWTGLSVDAFFDDDPFLAGQRVENIPVIDNLDELPLYVLNHEIDQVWFALPLEANERMHTIVDFLKETVAVDIRFVPDIFDFQLLNYSVSDVAGLPVLNLNESPMQGTNIFAKEIEDRFLSAFFLILTSPLFVIVALLVKLSSRGPVFYAQERVSWNSRPFRMLKFRSMPVEVEAESGPQWATPEDQRPTKFGKLLRKTSLDELPQLLNVLKGDMSIVGPRPERPVFIDKFKTEIPDYMQKHLVKAGITGWAQINGWRGDTDLQTRIEYDLYYIENWSVWFDIKIIFLTLFKGLISKQAY